MWLIDKETVINKKLVKKEKERKRGLKFEINKRVRIVINKIIKQRVNRRNS